MALGDRPVPRIVRAWTAERPPQPVTSWIIGLRWSEIYNSAVEAYQALVRELFETRYPRWLFDDDAERRAPAFGWSEETLARRRIKIGLLFRQQESWADGYINYESAEWRLFEATAIGLFARHDALHPSADVTEQEADEAPARSAMIETETIRVLTRTRGLVEVHHAGNLVVVTRQRRLAGVALMIGNEIMLPRTKRQVEAERKKRLGQLTRWQAANPERRRVTKRAAGRRRYQRLHAKKTGATTP